MKKFSTLDIEAVEKAELVQEPFPYMIIDNIIQPQAFKEVIATFPSIQKRGSFPLSSLTYEGAFAQFLSELQDPALKILIAERFEMDLEDKATMVTLRGQTTERDGQIHIDSKSKLITLLVYLNEKWESRDGCLRLLYNNKDLIPYAAEVPPVAGRCLIFKVTPNCWHGHTPFVGERRSIQLNYVTSEEAAERHLKRHKLSAFLKKLLKKDEARSAY